MGAVATNPQDFIFALSIHRVYDTMHAFFCAGITSNSTTGPQNESQVPCTPPLVRTEIRDMSPYLECSPKCLTEEWITEAEKQSLEVLLYLTGIIVWFCAVTTFITWAKIAEL